jgi:hypothetical protein
MNSTFTLTYNLTNTFTNTITNTYTHTNFPYKKDSVDKGLQGNVVKKSIGNIRAKASVDFNHISYPPTLPGRIKLPGRTPYA